MSFGGYPLAALAILVAGLSPVSASGGELLDSASVIQRDFNARDLVYDYRRDVLYASIPSSDEFHGNTIATIDPVTLEIVDSEFVGSEPIQLEITADASRVYVSIDGANSFRWWAPENDQLGPLRFVSASNTPLVVKEFAIPPDDPTTVVVSKDQTTGSNRSELEVFDDNGSLSVAGGTRLFEDQILFVDRETLVAYTGDLVRYEFDGQSLSEVDRVLRLITGRGIRIELGDDRLIYATDGKVVDPYSFAAFGTFSFFLTGPNPAIEPVSALGLTYAIGNATLEVYDNETFVPLENRDLGLPEIVSELISAGANRLAYLSSDGAIGVISDIPVLQVPTGNRPLRNASIAEQPLGAKDLVYDRERDLLYASIESNQGPPHGNTIASIDLDTLKIVSSVFVGSEPTRLEISADASRVFVSIEGANAFRSWIPGTDEAGPLRSIPTDSGHPSVVENFAVSPVDPETVVLSKHPVNTLGNGELEVLDASRSLSSLRFSSGNSDEIHFVNSGTLVAFLPSRSETTLFRYAFDGQALTEVDNIRGLIPGGTTRIEIGGDQRIYASNGKVVNPFSFSVLGTFSVRGTETSIEPVPKLGVTYAFGNGTLELFDNTSFVLLDHLDASEALDITELIGAGRDRLAYLSSTGRVGVISGIRVRQVPEPTERSLQFFALVGLALLYLHKNRSSPTPDASNYHPSRIAITARALSTPLANESWRGSTVMRLDTGKSSRRMRGVCVGEPSFEALRLDLFRRLP